MEKSCLLPKNCLINTERNQYTSPNYQTPNSVVWRPLQLSFFADVFAFHF